MQIRACDLCKKIIPEKRKVSIIVSVHDESKHEHSPGMGLLPIMGGSPPIPSHVDLCNTYLDVCIDCGFRIGILNASPSQAEAKVGALTDEDLKKLGLSS